MNSEGTSLVLSSSHHHRQVETSFGNRNRIVTNLLISRVIVKSIVESFRHTRLVAFLVLPYTFEAVEETKETSDEVCDNYDNETGNVARCILGPEDLRAYDIACERRSQ